MRVLVLEPGYSPYIALFRSTGEAIAQVIQGESQIQLPFDNNVIALICSKNQRDMPYNRTLTESLSVNGRVLICGWDGNQIRELTQKQANRYYRRYLYPERIADELGKTMAIPLNPRLKPGDERLGKRPFWRER